MKGASWLHWIGKEYDNTLKFLAEARRDGIRIAITLSELAALSWKDDIFCVKAQGKRKMGSVFCTFPMTRLSGLSEEIWDLLRDTYTTVITSDAGFVDNLTGSYLVGNVCTVMANIQDIATILEQQTKLAADVGKLMIGCQNFEVVTLPPPWGLLADVEKAQGFRQFSASRFEEDMEKVRVGRQFDKKVYGQYNADVKPSEEMPGDMEWIDHYESLDFDSVNRQTEFDFVV